MMINNRLLFACHDNSFVGVLPIFQESLHDFHMEKEGILHINMTKMKFKDVSKLWSDDDPGDLRSLLLLSCNFRN